LVPAVRLRLLRSSALSPLLVLNASNPDHRTLKTEHRLKIRIGGQLSHFLDLRATGPDVDFLFHLSNSHAKVDPKFVTDNMQGVLAAHFGTDVEDGVDPERHGKKMRWHPPLTGRTRDGEIVLHPTFGSAA
jgi:hypothetical protein